MIHLINMPFGSITCPGIAPGLIKAQLTQAGLDTRVFYLNLDFARSIGYQIYYPVSLSNVQIGEWLFAGQAWGESSDSARLKEFFSLHEMDYPRTVEEHRKIEQFEKIRASLIPGFLDQALGTLESTGDLQVIGFSCTYFQTLSSLALGRIIKQKYPHAKTVYGGAAFHGEPGEELIKSVPWIDAVSTGEADDIAVPLFRALLSGEFPAGLQGILYRDENGGVVKGKPGKPTDQNTFNSLPDPDFSEFFRSAEATGIIYDKTWKQKAAIPFESSRGCWWGQKKQCTFCGLNGQEINYRLKPGESVKQTLTDYACKYPVKIYYATDNNLSMAAFQDILPALAEDPLPNDAQLFYSLRPTLDRDQIRSLARAGITSVGPGIESLSTHLLRIMDKGVTALKNVFFLKCCREFGIHPRWNNLIRVPGENEQDYKDMEKLIPRLYHLAPPYGSGKIQCHRFSPYYENPGKWVENTRAEPWYKVLFALPGLDLDRVAYSFKADWKDVLDESAYNGVLEQVQTWRSLWTKQETKPELSVSFQKYASGPGTCARIKDTRTSPVKFFDLDRARTAVYASIADPAEISAIATDQDVQNCGLSSQGIEDILEHFVTKGLAIKEDKKYLGLAVQISR
ncbi:MAG: RiPP maturation radical SAM protein 1 [Desulfobacterales bacterium]|nr:RiPP maturation radical SAM protein 1 [Desulfobacterales bacterium]